jgi:hypothetical protein
MNTKLYKLNINLDGIGKNIGAAEEFFFNGLSDKMEIGKLNTRGCNCRSEMV